MLWQLTAIFLVLTNSFRAIQYRRIGFYERDLSAYTIAASYVCVGMVAMALVLPSLSEVNHDAAQEVWPRFIMGGVFFAILNFLVIFAYKFITASLGTFLSLLNVLSVIIFASIFLDEALSSRQLLGAVILFGSVVMIAAAARSKTDNKTRKQITIGVLIYLVIPLLLGPAAVNEKYLIDNIGLETYLLYGIPAQTLSAVVLGIIMSQRKRKSKQKVTIEMHRNVLLAALLLGLVFLFYILSLVGSDSASVVFLAQIAVVSLTVLLAYIILNERENMKLKLVGILLSGSGLYFLFT